MAVFEYLEKGSVSERTPFNTSTPHTIISQAWPYKKKNFLFSSTYIESTKENILITMIKFSTLSKFDLGILISAYNNGD